MKRNLAFIFYFTKAGHSLLNGYDNVYNDIQQDVKIEF